jgi:hypothetical protein
LLSAEEFTSSRPAHISVFLHNKKHVYLARVADASHGEVEANDHISTCSLLSASWAMVQDKQRFYMRLGSTYSFGDKP